MSSVALRADSKKARRVLKVLAQNPGYSSSQVFNALKGAVSRNYVYSVLAKHRSNLTSSTIPVGQNSEPPVPGLQIEGLVKAGALLSACGGSVEKAAEYLKAVALLRK